MRPARRSLLGLLAAAVAAPKRAAAEVFVPPPGGGQIPLAPRYEFAFGKALDAQIRPFVKRPLPRVRTASEANGAAVEAALRSIGPVGQSALEALAATTPTIDRKLAKSCVPDAAPALRIWSSPKANNCSSSSSPITAYAFSMPMAMPSAAVSALVCSSASARAARVANSASASSGDMSSITLSMGGFSAPMVAKPGRDRNDPAPVRGLG